MLTISTENGNYNYYEYWWSFWNVANATKRCLIDKYRELEYYIYVNSNNYREYFKKLILVLFNNDMEDIAKTFTPPTDMPNWKKRLIKEHYY